MASKIKVDQIQTADGSGTIALQNQLSGMTTASLPALGSAQMPTGSVLQVVSSTYSSAVQINSTSFQGTGLSATITPSSTSSKIAVMITASVGGDGGDGSYLYGGAFRDATQLIQVAFQRDRPATSFGANSSVCAITYLDSPSSTSAITYRLKGKATTSVHEFRMNYVSGQSMITLMEIAG